MVFLGIKNKPFSKTIDFSLNQQKKDKKIGQFLL